ncbi:MAG TPA: hypothetical protein VL947_11040 [Cytophagales bacterium]|nr:hypothetical protein [Cytophagales bacterium]
MNIEQLEKILAYENDDVLSRFMDMYDMDADEAQDIFLETKKFLYVSQLPTVFIPDDLLIIDEMWHNFILFTPQYHVFCKEHFQGYFHHLPASKKEKKERDKRRIEDPVKAKEEYLEKLKSLIETIFDHLGEETVIKWFQVYPQKYSKDAIKALRK